MAKPELECVAYPYALSDEQMDAIGREAKPGNLEEVCRRVVGHTSDGTPIETGVGPAVVPDFSASEIPYEPPAQTHANPDAPWPPRCRCYPVPMHDALKAAAREMAAPIVAGIECIRIMYPDPFDAPLRVRRALWTNRVVRAMGQQHPYPWPEGEARRHVDAALDELGRHLDAIVGAVNGWECGGDR